MTGVWVRAAALSAMIGTAALTAPALADVKAGVDAWQQGDYARAIGEWRPLAQAGDADAQFNMGQAYKLGRGVQADMSTAMDWYRKAAAQGHARAEDNLGLLMFQQGDRAGAMPYLQKSAARGEGRAQYIVATALFNGDQIGKDWVRAYALMTRASASGLPQAATSLQQMDKYIPEDQRRKGLALAADMEEKSSQLAMASAGPRTTAPGGAPARPAPEPVRTTTPSPSTPRATEPAPKASPIQPKPAQPKAVAAAPKAATEPKPVAPRPTPSVPAPAVNGGWRVQLGAFSEDGRARALWGSLAAKVPGLSAYKPIYVAGGGVTRLQAGPLASSVDADRLCARIKASGAACIPRKM